MHSHGRKNFNPEDREFSKAGLLNLMAYIKKYPRIFYIEG